MTNEEFDRKRIEIISKAWTDDSFKAKLLSDPVETLKAEGLDFPAGQQVRIHEDTEDIAHFVLPATPKELTNQDLDAVSGGFSLFRPFSHINAGGFHVNSSPGHMSAGSWNPPLNRDDLRDMIMNMGGGKGGC
jgi:hypothetical protein